MSCDTSYYRTPYNIQMQDLYCNMAQRADTDLSRVVTSGWSYDRFRQQPQPQPQKVENYCNCNSRAVNTPMNLDYREENC